MTTTERDTDKKRVLIVEDEEGLLEGLEHNFKYEGYDVLTARNGSEGLKAALKQKPDVVVLDIMLHEKDGFTVKYPRARRAVPSARARAPRRSAEARSRCRQTQG